MKKRISGWFNSTPGKVVAYTIGILIIAGWVGGFIYALHENPPRMDPELKKFVRVLGDYYSTNHPVYIGRTRSSSGRRGIPIFVWVPNEWLPNEPSKPEQGVQEPDKVFPDPTPEQQKKTEEEVHAMARKYLQNNK